MIEYLIPIIVSLSAVLVIALVIAHALELGIRTGAELMARETREYLERHTDEAGA